MFPIFIPSGGIDTTWKQRLILGIAIIVAAVAIAMIITGAIIDEPYRQKGIYDNPGNTLASIGAATILGEGIIGMVALGISLIRTKDDE